jgi:hypothetical protein
VVTGFPVRKRDKKDLERASFHETTNVSKEVAPLWAPRAVGQATESVDQKGEAATLWGKAMTASWVNNRSGTSKKRSGVRWVPRFSRFFS